MNGLMLKNELALLTLLTQGRVVVLYRINLKYSFIFNFIHKDFVTIFFLDE